MPDKRKLYYTNKFTKKLEFYLKQYSKRTVTNRSLPFVQNEDGVDDGSVKTFADLLSVRLEYIKYCFENKKQITLGNLSPHPMRNPEGVKKDTVRWDIHIFNDLVVYVDVYYDRQLDEESATFTIIDTHSNLKLTQKKTRGSVISVEKDF